jgi:hypothetical protein
LHRSLFGFVIPFLRIPDLKKFSSEINGMLKEDELHKKQIQALRILKQTISAFSKAKLT